MKPLVDLIGRDLWCDLKGGRLIPKALAVLGISNSHDVCLCVSNVSIVKSVNSHGMNESV